MKNILIIFLILIPVLAYCQFPANPRKIALGYQTTADGLIYRASGPPFFTPVDNDDARAYINTDNGDYYVYNSGWILMSSIQDLADTSAVLRALIGGMSPATTTTIYCPAHGLDTADYVGSVFGLMATCDLANSLDADSLQTRYVVDIPHVDSLEIQVSGMIYRPGHGLTPGVIYFLQDDGDNGTSSGTVESKVFVVLDADYLHLIDPSNASLTNFFPVVYVPAPAFSVYGTDVKAPHDTAVQNIAEVYAAAGAIVPGSFLVAANTVTSDNDIYRRNADGSGTGAHAWHWNGQNVTRVAQMITSISLTDTLYGGSGIIEIDSVNYTGDYPITDSVIVWLENNYTNNGLRLVNGSLMYFIGNGTAQNPDWIWQIVDDASGNVEGSTKWTRLVKLVKAPAQELSAENVTFTPASTITATDAQAAIVEALTDANAYTDALGMSDLVDHTANQDILLDGNSLSDDGTGGLLFDGGQAYLTPNSHSLNNQATALTISHSSGGASEVLRLVETVIPSLKFMTYQQAEDQWSSIISDAGATISYEETGGLDLSTIDAEPVKIGTDGSTRATISATGQATLHNYGSGSTFTAGATAALGVDNSGNIVRTTASSGTTEVADGTTILGDGTGGDPFRVDTALIVTTAALNDSIAGLSSTWLKPQLESTGSFTITSDSQYVWSNIAATRKTTYTAPAVTVSDGAGTTYTAIEYNRLHTQAAAGEYTTVANSGITSENSGGSVAVYEPEQLDIQAISGNRGRIYTNLAGEAGLQLVHATNGSLFVQPDFYDGPDQTYFKTGNIEINSDQDTTGLGGQVEVFNSATGQVELSTVGPAGIASTAVTPGSYTYASLTVDADGRLTAASSGATPGDVTGPGSSTDNAIARFDGTGGKTLQNSSVLISDAGQIGVGGETPGTGGSDVAIGGLLRVTNIRLTGAGSPSSVAFQFDDTNTGFIRDGVDKASIVTGGVRALTMDASQFVGIQNTTPLTDLDVNGTARIRDGEIQLDATGGAKIKTGSGSPESVVSASPGSTYHDTTGGDLYVKESGTGSTGWALFQAGAGIWLKTELEAGTDVNIDATGAQMNVSNADQIEFEAQVGAAYAKTTYTPGTAYTEAIDGTGNAAGLTVESTGITGISTDGIDTGIFSVGPGVIGLDAATIGSDGLYFLAPSFDTLVAGNFKFLTDQDTTGRDGQTLTYVDGYIKLAASAAASNIYNTNGTQDDATRTWNINSQDLYVTNAGTLYLGADNAAFEDYMLLDASGINFNSYDGVNSTNSFLKTETAASGGRPALQYYGNTATKGVEIWAELDASNTQEGVRMSVEESTTAADDKNLFWGDHYSNEGLWITTGDKGANISTHTVYFTVDIANNDILVGKSDTDVVIQGTIWLDSGKTVGIFHGTGSPESAVTAAVGSTFHRTDGGANTTLYVKESGSGNTGWIAK